MHDAMFGNQAKIGVDDLKATAAGLGVKAEQFDKCLDSGKYAASIKADADDGTKYGVTGTPAFFINGRSLVGAQPADAFNQLIAEELESKGIAVPPPPPAAPPGLPAGTTAPEGKAPAPAPTKPVAP